MAVAGAGYFSAFHVDGWLRNPDAELVALADPEPGKADTLLQGSGHRTEGIATFSDSAAMFQAVRPDIIDIAAPPAAHRGLIAAALQTGAAAIVCQKPFCGGLAQARAAVADAQRAGKLVVVHENFRFQPWYRALRRELDAGRVGRLYQVTFRLRPGDGQGADAYLARQPYFRQMDRFLIHETAIHWVDTFRFLMGEPASVYADLRRLNPAIAGEDCGLFLYRFADGRRALFDGNRLADHAARNPRLTMGECLVEGAAGAIALDGDGRLSFRARADTGWIPLAVDISQAGFGGDCVHALQCHVTDHLLHGTPLENDAGSYLRNMEIEEALYRSAATDRSVEV